MYITTKNPSQSDYSRFVLEGLTIWTEENPTNVKYDFSKMSKIFGLSYIYWLEIQYRIWEESKDVTLQSLEDISKWNGNVPIKFFERFKETRDISRVMYGGCIKI